jgi:diguanylate cyclase (GGDEF)-like protein/PAS domain S-box-containing protein
VVESALDAIITADQDGRIIEFNHAAERLFGLERSQVLTQSILDTILHPSVRPSHHTLLGPGPGRGGQRIETLGLHKSGRQFPVELVLTPIQLARRRFYTAYLRDLSERQRKERRTAAAHAVTQVLVEARTSDEALPPLLAALGGELDFDLAAIWRGDDPDALRCAARWSSTRVDPAAVQRTIDEAVQGAEALVPRALESGRAVWLDHPATEDRWPTAVVLPLPARDGMRSVVGLFSQTVHDEDPELLAQLAMIVGQVAEFLERKQAEHRLCQSEARHRALLRAMPDLILRLSHEGVCIDCNVPATSRGLLTPTKFTGRHLSDSLPVGVARLMVQHLGRALTTGEIQTFESEISLAGVPHRWEVRVAACGDREALALLRDVTDRKRAEEQIRTLAYRDSLTELPNRLLFHDRLRIALAQAQRQQLRPSVLILDLDRFKQINDTLGHSFGDRVLREVAGRLARNVREGDTVARLGGDEFSLLVPDAATSTDVARVAGKLLDKLRRPLRIEGHEVFVTPSIGISVYPGDGRDVETLIKNAEVALYRGKERGGNGYQLYAPAMNARAAERLALENSLRHAAAREEFELHYQPVADVQRGRIWGVEALLRWRHPELGLVLPDDFVPLAESAGLLGPIAPWVLRTACRQIRDWQLQHGMELWVAVNLSLRQFQHPSLVRLAAEALEAAGLPPRCLALEITETSAMQNAEVTIHTLRQLRTLGVRVAIDDFGVGYSSLSHLRRLPLDTLKIDRSFVRDIADDPGDAAIVRALVALARSLGLTVVAEGVETEEQLSFLRNCRCDGMQGFLLSPPLPPDACGELLQAHA